MSGHRWRWGHPPAPSSADLMIERASPGLLHLLLVDDHAVVREGLKRILTANSSQWHITEASSGFEALEILRQVPLDLAIVDLSMPGMSGLELIHRIHGSFPSVMVLVLSMHAEEQYAIRAFKSGAKGYVTKCTAAEELVAAVVKVAAGGAYVTTRMAERLVQQFNGSLLDPNHAQLSNRELDVLQRIVAGQRLTDIAAALHLSIKTVSTHKSHIQEKLQLPSTAALIRYGLEHQIGHGDAGLYRHQT